MRPVNHGGLGSRYAGQLRKSAAGPPDRSNRPGPRGPDLGRGGPDLADFAGAADQRQEALEQAIIEKAVDRLSGPGGLASFLRTRQLGARLAGPSLGPPAAGHRVQQDDPGGHSQPGHPAGTAAAGGPADTSSKHVNQAGLGVV